MKVLRRLGVALLLAATAQGCATVGGKKIAAKKRPSPSAQITHQSFALMDDSAGMDQEIAARGNKARGITDY